MQLSQNQFDALVCFAYNGGCGPIQKVAGYLNSGDSDSALNYWRSYDNNGLLKTRRAIEINTFNS